MKELYEAPEAKLIGFAPMEKLASDWDWSKSVPGATEEPFADNSDSQVDIIYPGENPEGSFGR